MNKIFGVLALVALAGCTMSVKDPQEVISGTKTNFDQYSGVHAVVGPKMDPGSFPNITQIWLTAGISAKPAGNYVRLSVWHWNQTGWKFLSSASDSDAAPLVLNQKDRDTEYNDFFKRTSFVERVSVDLSEKYLEEHASSGLNIQLRGQKSSIIAELQPAYVQGFLEKYRAERDQLEFAQPPAPDKSGRLSRALAPSTGISGSGAFGAEMREMPTAMANAMKTYAPLMQSHGAQLGVTVASVSPETPAAKAGLVAKDMILEFDGKPVSEAKEIRDLAAAVSSGTKIVVKVRRLGQVIELTAQM